MKEWRPVDILVMFLSLTVGILLLSSVAQITITGGALSETKAKTIAGVVSSVVAIISIYVGSKIKNDKL